MKKTILTLCALLLLTDLFAQAPQKMSYQTVVRNSSNNLISSTTVGIQISIIQGAPFGVASFIERHTPVTNLNGLATIQIGNGTPIAGSFASIDWANGPYYIKTDVDPSGGTVYSITGTTELLSVPYALFAATSGNSGGSTLDGAYDQGGAGAGRTITVDAGAVQINNSGTNTTGLEVNSAVNNSTAVLANVSGIGVGFRAESTNPANSFAAIQANSNSTNANNSAILGNNSGSGYAVSGQIPATATGAAAVYGSNLRTSGGYGVQGIGFNGTVGQSQNAQGFGVYGVNNSPATGTAPSLGIGSYGLGFHGVFGQTTNTTTGWAGYFTADLGVEGTGYAVGGWLNASDRRLKTNIQPIGSALEKINRIHGVHYTITTKSRSIDGEIKSNSREQYGVIAQDVEKVFPEMVKEKALFLQSGDDTLYKTVDYTQLVPVLLEAIKELQSEVEMLKQEVETLKK